MKIEDPRQCEVFKNNLKAAGQHKERDGATDSESVNSQLTVTILGFWTSKLLSLSSSEHQSGKHSALSVKSSMVFSNSTLSEDMLNGPFLGYVTNIKPLHTSVELEIHYPKGRGLHLTYSLHF